MSLSGFWYLIWIKPASRQTINLCYAAQRRGRCLKPRRGQVGRLEQRIVTGGRSRVVGDLARFDGCRLNGLGRVSDAAYLLRVFKEWRCTRPVVASRFDDWSRSWHKSLITDKHPTVTFCAGRVPLPSRFDLLCCLYTSYRIRLVKRLSRLGAVTQSSEC